MHIGHVMLADVFCNAVGDVVASLLSHFTAIRLHQECRPVSDCPDPDMPPGETCLKSYVHAIGFRKSDKVVYTCFSGCDFPVAAHELRSGSLVCRRTTENGQKLTGHH
tara:strand:- start:75 stop:398 length:324 start_codon:yes stop_codon:yes gene_type:complete